MSGASRWLDAPAPLGPRPATPAARASPSAASAVPRRRVLVERIFPAVRGTVLAWVRPRPAGGWVAVRFRSLTHPWRRLLRMSPLLTIAFRDHMRLSIRPPQQPHPGFTTSGLTEIV